MSDIAKDNDTVCETCGSADVEVKAWVNVNTDAINWDGETDTNDRWCNNCEEHTDFTTRFDYNRDNIRV